MDRFWLTDEQFAKVAPHLPRDTRGKERVDDRRVISGIVHVLKSGGRWADAPAEIYGPKKTLYNRFVRWAAKGVWTGLFEALASAGGPPAQVLIDSSAVKAHRCASGGKGGSRAKPSAARAAAARPRSTPSPTCSAVRSPSC
jgi:transposase